MLLPLGYAHVRHFVVGFFWCLARIEVAVMESSFLVRNPSGIRQTEATLAVAERVGFEPTVWIFMFFSVSSEEKDIRKQ